MKSTIKQNIHKLRPYSFMPYDANWPKLYNKHANVLRKIFTHEIILLEHIGSTSIPGMWAKPQIDILITVKDFNKIPSFYDLMKTHGYTVRGDYTSEGEEYFTKDTPDGFREVSIHILPNGHPWAIDLIDLRDYLRSHPKEAKLYSDIKRKMNREFPNDYSSYFNGKRQTVHAL